MKLTTKEKWMKFWGLKYKVNHKSKEIHRLHNKHVNCNTHRIVNGEFVTEKKAFKLLKEGYNGCRYCWREKDNG